jgi:hypothetical protein
VHTNDGQEHREIASQLGAKAIAQVPDVGGGAFGAARLACIIEQLRNGCATQPSSRFHYIIKPLSQYFYHPRRVNGHLEKSLHPPPRVSNLPLHDCS